MNASVSDDRLFLVSFEGRDGYVSTGPADPEPIRLGRLSLYVQHWARAQGDRVATSGYQYQIAVDQQPLFEFHFHPGRRVEHCHVHVSADAPNWLSLRKVHLPTGRVALEDVLLMLVTDLGVTPRSNAVTRLAQQRRRFERLQTWSGPRPSSQTASGRSA